MNRRPKTSIFKKYEGDSGSDPVKIKYKWAQAYDIGTPAGPEQANFHTFKKVKVVLGPSISTLLRRKWGESS